MSKTDAGHSIQPEPNFLRPVQCLIKSVLLPHRVQALMNFDIHARRFRLLGTERKPAVHPISEDANGKVDVLPRLRTGIVNGQPQRAVQGRVDCVRQAHTARLRKRLQSRGNVYAVSENIFVLLHQIAKADAHAKLEFGTQHDLVRQAHCAAFRLASTGQGYDPSIPHALDDLATVASNQGFKAFGAKAAQGLSVRVAFSLIILAWPTTSAAMTAASGLTMTLP